MTPTTGPEALLHYDTPEFQVIRPGAYVTCAVSGVRIPLERLNYWSVELQEAYASAGFMVRRWRETR